MYKDKYEVGHNMTGIAKDQKDFDGACLIFLGRQKNKAALGRNGPRPQVTDGPSDQMQTERQASLVVPGPSNASLNSSQASSDPSLVVLPVGMCPLVPRGPKRSAEEAEPASQVRKHPYGTRSQKKRKDI